MGILCSKNVKDQCLPFLQDESFSDPSLRNYLKNPNSSGSNNFDSDGQSSNLHNDEWHLTDNKTRDLKKIRLGYHKYFDYQNVDPNHQPHIILAHNI